MDTTVALIILALVLIAAAAAAALLFAQNARKRHQVIQHRFGPEYERALAEYGTPDRAERALSDRAKP